MIGSRFQSAGTGMGIIPLIIAAATIGAQMYGQKKEEKAAEEQAKAAQEAAALAAKRKRAEASTGVSKWVWIAGGAAVLGVGAWALTRRSR